MVGCCSFVDLQWFFVCHVLTSSGRFFGFVMDCLFALCGSPMVLRLPTVDLQWLVVGCLLVWLLVFCGSPMALCLSCLDLQWLFVGLWVGLFGCVLWISNGASFANCWSPVVGCWLFAGLVVGILLISNGSLFVMS